MDTGEDLVDRPLPEAVLAAGEEIGADDGQGPNIRGFLTAV